MTLPRNFCQSFADFVEPLAAKLDHLAQGETRSPIEHAFLVASMLACRIYGHKLYRFSPDQEIDTSFAKSGFFIAPQRRFPPYTIDFLMGSWVGDRRYELIVECDGHDFHERTKEQAAHDRQRDRFMQAEGFRVLRFTGAEIYRSAFDCAGEAILQVINLEEAGEAK